MLFYYSTHDGQARRIAQRISDVLHDHGIAANPQDVSLDPPTGVNLAQTDLLILVASVRYGHHGRAAEALIRRYARLETPPPLVLASVNLTARKPDRHTPQDNPYLRKWIRCHHLSPVLTTAFAGRLDYPHYAWWERQIIRLIMTMTGGETNPTACIDYTSWSEVDNFAHTLSTLIGETSLA